MDNATFHGVSLKLSNPGTLDLLSPESVHFSDLYLIIEYI